MAQNVSAQQIPWHPIFFGPLLDSTAPLQEGKPCDLSSGQWRVGKCVRTTLPAVASNLPEDHQCLASLPISHPNMEDPVENSEAQSNGRTTGQSKPKGPDLSTPPLTPTLD